MCCFHYFCDMESEQGLAARFNSGDMEAFRQIYRKYTPVMQAFAAKFTDVSTAQDLVQDVFMRVWVNRERSPIHSDMQSYLFHAVRNRCINHLEHLKVRASYETREIIDLQIREVEFFQSPEQLLIRQEQIDRVRAEIDKLPGKTREAFKMAYLENRKAAEIAEEMHVSVRTVETQIYKALKTLRAVLFNSK